MWKCLKLYYIIFLSANICDDFIVLMGQKVLWVIVDEVLQANYYSISVTPDISHVDQLTFTITYVKKVNVAERFLEVVPIRGYGAKHLADIVTQFLTEKRRCQSYDNASNMSGCYTGLQERLKK